MIITKYVNQLQEPNQKIIRHYLTVQSLTICNEFSFRPSVMAIIQTMNNQIHSMQNNDQNVMSQIISNTKDKDD